MAGPSGVNRDLELEPDNIYYFMDKQLNGVFSMVPLQSGSTKPKDNQFHLKFTLYANTTEIDFELLFSAPTASRSNLCLCFPSDCLNFDPDQGCNFPDSNAKPIEFTGNIRQVLSENIFLPENLYNALQETY